MNAALVNGALPPGMSPREWWAAVYPGAPFPGRLSPADARDFDAYDVASLRAAEQARQAAWPPGMSPREWWSRAYPGKPFPASGRLSPSDAKAYDAYDVESLRAAHA